MALVNQTSQLQNPLGTESFLDILQMILSGAIIILTPVIVVAFVIVGTMFVFAHGNPQKITDAKSALLWTIVGAFIVLVSSGISALIQNTAEQFTDKNNTTSVSSSSTAK